MASKKFLELQEFSIEDLKGELAQTEADFQNLKFDHAVKGLDDPMRLREVRRDIARLKTEIRRRELEALSEEELSNRTRIRRRRRRHKKA